MGDRRTIVGLVLAKTPGYSETFLLSKIRGLVKNGIDVVLFVNTKSASKIQGVKIVSAPSLPSYPIFRFLKIGIILFYTLLICPRRLLKLARISKHNKVGIYSLARTLFISSHILPYHLDWLHFAFCTLAINKEDVAEVIGARMSVSLRGYDIGVFPLKNKNVYELVWNKVKKVHTISDDLYKEACRLGLAPSVPYKKIQPAINVSSFVNPDERSYNSAMRILTVARLEWKKGLEVSLGAMALLKKQGLKFTYTIVGEGNEQERLLFARYQLGLTDDVIFLGHKAHSEIPGVMRENDFYLQPSLQEGFCNAVIEAQASGLLCVVSDAEGLPENVLDGITGWVVPRWDEQFLANKLIQINNLPLEEKHRISQSAVSRAQREFLLEDQENKFKAFFN